MDIVSLVNNHFLIHPIDDVYNTGNNLFILRDDLLPFGLGGNKVRIAIEFIEDMKATGKNAMIAYGSSTSNMCRAIANLCKAQNIPCTVILSRSSEDSQPCNNQRLMDLYGARSLFCTMNSIAQTVQKAITYYENQGLKPYYIFGNEFGQGNEHVAARAYAKAYAGIAKFAHNNEVSFDRIFCASGTQSTQAGLMCGHILASDNSHIQGIMISSRSEERARQAITDAATTLLTEYGLHNASEIIMAELSLITTKRRGGYGVYDQSVLDCISKQLCSNGIPFDPVYTGKAFLGMQEYLLEEGISGETILFVHTGGEPIFYDCLQANNLD